MTGLLSASSDAQPWRAPYSELLQAS